MDSIGAKNLLQSNSLCNRCNLSQLPCSSLIFYYSIISSWMSYIQLKMIILSWDVFGMINYSQGWEYVSSCLEFRVQIEESYDAIVTTIFTNDNRFFWMNKPQGTVFRTDFIKLYTQIILHHYTRIIFLILWRLWILKWQHRESIPTGMDIVLILTHVLSYEQV